MRKSLEILGWLTALLIFAFASHAVLAQTAPEGVRVSVSSAQEPQHRARKTSEAEDENPASIMRAARKLYVLPSTRIDKKYLEYKLQKNRELRDWGLMIVEDERVADLVLKVDQTALNYIFSITDPHTSIVIVSGKVVAINDLVAAEYLGTEIVKKIKDVRASSDSKPSKSKSHDTDEDSDE